MQLMYQRVSEPPRDPRRARADLPDYIANIILKCLEKDPAKRYQSAREILADSTRRTRRCVTNAGGKTISIQIRKPTRRGSIVAAGDAAACWRRWRACRQTRHAIQGVLPGAPAVERDRALHGGVPYDRRGDPGS